MTGPAGPPALLCTDTIHARCAERIAHAAPDIDVVTLMGDDIVSVDDLGRVQVAFFSRDAWPERSSRFMGAVRRAPELRWLHTFSSGTDHPVFTGLLERGVRVTASSGAGAAPIAGTVLMYLLALSRNLPQMLRAQAAHEWSPQRFDDLEGHMVGVVGIGPIGREVIRLTTAIGMRAVGVRRTVVGDEPCPTWPADRLPELAAAVDALVVALPLTAETRGVISSEVIGRMRPDAVLVDEAALTDALVAGRLRGAALDVFATEPLPADSLLWDLPNVIVTPHSSGMTHRADERVDEIFLTNLAAYARGDALTNER